MDTAITDPAAWAEHGLPGLMLAALGAFIFWSTRSSRAERAQTQDAHAKEREEILSAHRAERKEWKDDADRRDDRVYVVVNELKEVIRANRASRNGGE